MFVLTSISDLVRVPPELFNQPLHRVLKDELHKKYSNKVISNLGLAVAVWDMSEIHDGALRPGDGGSYVEVKFRMVVWKPFIGETLCGWVADCSEQGIKVRMEFFDDIFIPKDYLFEGCVFKPVERAWVWKPDEESELFIDINEKIRFRVEEEVFVNIKPNPTLDSSSEDSQQDRAPPYALIASCQTDGMGCVSWWD